jgi:alanine racemase
VNATLTIDLEAIAANWRLLHEMHAAPVAAVVKADGYGLGAAQVAARLFREGVRRFFVAHPDEGRALRLALPGALIGILNGLWPGEDRALAEDRLVPVLGSLDEIARWQALARARGHALSALIHIDTGMNRLGLDARELARLAAEPSRLDGIRLRYWMTHLARSEAPSDPRNAEQRARFAASCARLPPAPISIANSSGIFLGEAFRSDLARPGAALYGINPTPGRPNPMRPVARLAARVLQLREVASGEAVGYEATWVAARPTRVATVSVGYADGYLRALSNLGEARFDGRAVPLIGRVSMDLATFDVTDHPAVRVGSELMLLGPGLDADAVAARAGTNGYEILTSLGARYRRRYAPL